MHANIINGLILLAIIASIVALYCCAYSRGITTGTDSGYDGGYNAGKSAGVAEASKLVHTTRADAEQLRRLREVERQDHKLALEAITHDYEQRLALFARRANPFTHEDRITLQAAANQLHVAANTYTGLHAPDEARFARQMQQRLLNLAEQLRIALEHGQQQALPQLAATAPDVSAAA